MKIETKFRTRTLVDANGVSNTFVTLVVLADGSELGDVSVASGRTAAIGDLDPETAPLDAYAGRLGFR